MIVYDQGQNYMQCLKQILIDKRRHSRAEIEKKFPLFIDRFPEMFDIVFKRHIEVKDMMKTEQTHMYDGRTFAESVYFLLCETKNFDAVGKRSAPETMGLWTAWYENMMRENFEFYDAFKVLMRNICEGRMNQDRVICVQIASIDMAHRKVISHKQRADVMNDFITRKGTYKDIITKYKITAQEWQSGIQEYFQSNQQTIEHD